MIKIQCNRQVSSGNWVIDARSIDRCFSLPSSLSGAANPIIQGINEGHNVIWIISLFTPVTDEWFHRMEIKQKGNDDGDEECFFHSIARYSHRFCMHRSMWNRCVCVGSENKNSFCAFADRFGFRSLLSSFFAAFCWLTLLNSLPLNQFNRNAFICEKSGGKFFDIKVRMLRMYACASPTRLDGYFVDCLLPLLLLLPHFRSLHQLFPVPFRSSSSPSSPLPVHETKKWNKLKLIKSNKRRFLCFEKITVCFSSGSFCARLRHA